MSGIQFSPKSLQDLPLKQLGDASLKVDVAEASASYDGTPSAGGVTFSIEASAKATIHAYNSPDDLKDEGVIGLPPEEDDGDEGVPAMPPQIAFDPARAWLKYRVEAGVKGSAEVSFPPVGIEAGGQAKVVFADYHAHSRDEVTAQAIAADLPRLRFAGDASDAAELGEGEALSYQVYGKLTAGVTLKWSDVITAGLGSLSGLLRPSELIKINVTPSVNVAFSVEVEDDFLLVFTKGAGGRVGVAVRKAKSRQVGFKAGATVGAEFADESVVERALGDLYEAALGATMTRVNNLFEAAKNAASFDQLTPAQKKLAEAIIARLNLGGVVQKPKDLKKRWDEIQSQIAGRVKQAAKTKVELAFTYEYLRVKTDEALLLAELDADAFAECHGQLMRRDISGALEALRGGRGLVKFYLRQETLERTRAWGFTLGIEPFGIKVGGRDKVSESRVTQENVLGERRIAYDGLRRYDAEWNGDKVSWHADFKAEMKSFSASPTTCDFDYGLSFNWTWEEKELSEGELRQCLDNAALWRVIRPGSVAEAAALFEGRFGEKATVALEFKLEGDDLKALLPAALSPAEAVILDGQELKGDRKLDFYGAHALAAAMPYNELFAGRREQEFRVRLYRPLWLLYFADDSKSASAYASDASNHVRTKGGGVPDFMGLAEYERGPQAGTFSKMITLHAGGLGNSGVHRNWNRFVKGLKALNSLVQKASCVQPDAVEKAFDDLRQFWHQSLYMRAAGAFLLDRAERQGMLDRVERSLTVTFGDDEVVSVGQTS